MASCFRFFKILLALFCSLSLLWEGCKFWQLNQLVEKRQEILREAKSEATIPPMPPGSGDRYWVLGKYLYDLSGDPHFWINRAMAAHYGLDEVRAEGGRTSAWQAPAKGAVIPMELKCADNVLEAEIRPEDSAKLPDRLHIYYYGEPALLCALPYSAGEKILAWLARAGGSGIKGWLVPILLARADIALKNSPDGVLAMARLLLIFFRCAGKADREAANPWAGSTLFFQSLTIIRRRPQSTPALLIFYPSGYNILPGCRNCN